MAVERKDPGAGRPLRGVPPVLPSAPPVRPRARPVPRPPGGATRVAGRLAGLFTGLFTGVPGVSVRALLLWPTLVTLSVTLLRLTGELRGWSPATFSRLPGGGLSPLGITWLAPLVGFYFGWRLERAGVRSPSPAVGFGLPAAALVVGPLLAAGCGWLFKTSWTANFTLWALVSVGVAAAAFAAWPALGRLLLAYAYAARIPVVLVMAVAIWKGWRTHYDVPPPGFPFLPPLRRWLWISVLPQMTIWVAWTMATGAVGGALGWRAASRRPR